MNRTLGGQPVSETIQIQRDDNTLKDEAWNIQLIGLNQDETVIKGASTYSPIPNYNPQDIATTNNVPPFSGNNLTVTLMSSVTITQLVGYFSNMPNAPSSSWVLLNNYESPPLTEEEVSDIQRSWEEIRMGKTKKFNNVRDAIEWLHSQRGK